MKYIRALRRLLANTDRVNDLVVATEKMKEAIDKIVERMDQLYHAAGNQATAVNGRLDRVYEALDNQASAVNERLDRLYEAADNQSSAANLRMDRIIAAVRGDDPDGIRPDEKRRVRTDLSDGLKNAVQGTTSRAIAGGRTGERAAPIGTAAERLSAHSPSPLPPPGWSEKAFSEQGGNSPIRVPANKLRDYQPLLDALQPWEGVVPEGYRVDFLGTLTDAHFGTMYAFDYTPPDGGYRSTELPRFNGENGEWWFEAINWLEAAREARDRFVMITLGAFYGAQAVGAHRALQIVNPLPCKLVAVEPVPENYLWLRKHFYDNGIDPDAHWLINTAISDRNEPIFFPVGGAGSTANCMSTDQAKEREDLADRLIREGKADAALRSLLRSNTTGILKELVPGQGVNGEIKLISAVTLRDLLSAFEMIDYLEADIQQSEVRVFPPFMELLRRKVRRIHIGTHGADNHEMLHQLFERNGWQIVFSYPPDGKYKSELGAFELSDGVLTVRNPDL